MTALDDEARMVLTNCLADGIEPPTIWRTLAEHEHESRLLTIVDTVCAAGCATAADTTVA